MIRTPKKYNHAYVQVDNKGEPLYGLTEVGNIISKIYPCQKDIKYVVLPEYGEINLDRYDIGESWMNDKELKYIEGQIILGEHCFEGMKNFKLVLPARTSVKINPLAFDSDAKVELILPEGYELKTIVETHANNPTPKRYTLIADKAVKVMTYGEPMVQSQPFNPDFLDGNVTISKELRVKNGEFVSAKESDFDGTEIQ